MGSGNVQKVNGTNATPSASVDLAASSATTVTALRVTVTISMKCPKKSCPCKKAFIQGEVFVCNFCGIKEKFRLNESFDEMMLRLSQEGQENLF